MRALQGVHERLHGVCGRRPQVPLQHLRPRQPHVSAACLCLTQQTPLSWLLCNTTAMLMVLPSALEYKSCVAEMLWAAAQETLGVVARPDSYYSQLGPDGRRVDVFERPELCRGAVEFVATSEYMVRVPGAEMSMICCVSSLPRRSRVCGHLKVHGGTLLNCCPIPDRSYCS